MLQPSLPREFLTKCREDERTQVEAWWQGLNHETREDVCVLIDRRQASMAYVFGDFEQGRRVWKKLPIVAIDRDEQDAATEKHEDEIAFFQQVLDEAQLISAAEVQIHSLRICTAHPHARQVVSEGQVDSSFCCPVGRTDCPIHSLTKTISSGRLLSFQPESQQTLWLCLP